MSKPNKAGELRNVEVNAVSLVSKAANGERFKIFKSAEKAPETVEKTVQGLVRVLKNFFLGEIEPVEKGAVKDILTAQENGRRLGEATEALFKALNLSRWGENSETPETNPAKIRAALEDFKKVAEEILISSDEEVKKTAEEVRKSGRKISSSRLAKIKEVHAILGDLIADTENTEGGAEEVTKEELIAEVKKSVNEVVEPINKRLEELEKNTKSDNTKSDDSVKKTESDKKTEPQPDVGEVVKSALGEALKPITERLERVEKARGLSNSQPEDINLKKSANDFWDGAFGI